MWKSGAKEKVFRHVLAHAHLFKPLLAYIALSRNGIRRLIGRGGKSKTIFGSQLYLDDGDIATWLKVEQFLVYCLLL